MTMFYTMIADPVIATILMTSLSVLFLASGWQHLKEMTVFIAIVENYRILPAALVAWFCKVFSVAEVACGLMLLYPGGNMLGGCLALALLLSATAAVTFNLIRQHTAIECGCGGISSQQLSWPLVVRNVVLIMIAIVVTRLDTQRSMQWLDHLTIALGVIGLTGIYTICNQLMANASIAFQFTKK